MKNLSVVFKKFQEIPRILVIKYNFQEVDVYYTLIRNA